MHFSVKHRAGRHSRRDCRWPNLAPGAWAWGKARSRNVSFARTAGYSKVTLWTQSILTAAHHIYQQADSLTREDPHHSFGVT